MNTYQRMVEEFHQATDSTVGFDPDLRDNELRAKLILEEAVETAAALGFAVKAAMYYTPQLEAFKFDERNKVAEFEKSYGLPDILDAIDGLADLLYVTFGSAVAWGIDLDPFFAEVHRANMDKLAGPKREDGKQLKPEGWKPPNIEKYLIYQRNLAEAWKDMEAEFLAAETRHERLLNGEAA